MTPKDLSLRLRHWLIKKLGGFTEQYTISRFNVNQVEIKPEIIRIEMSAHVWQPISEQEMVECVKTKICNDIASELMKNDFVVLERKDDLRRYDRIYRGTVAVFNAKDTARFLTEVEYLI